MPYCADGIRTRSPRRSVPRRRGPSGIEFDGLGLFRRGRTWLVAGVSADFVARQQRVVDAVTATGADLHKHYVPGTWLPH